MKKFKSFVFYESYFDAVNALDEQYRAEATFAIAKFGLTGVMVKTMSNPVKQLMRIIKPNMESLERRYRANVENGKKGGAPKGNTNAKKTSENQENVTQKQPNSTQKQAKTTQEQPNSTGGLNEKTTENNPNININNKIKINNNINNKQNIQNKENNSNRVVSQNDDVVVLSCNEMSELDFYLSVLKDKIKNISDESNITSRFSEMINRVAESKETFVINGKTHEPKDILGKYVNLLAGNESEVISKLQEVYEQIDNNTNITNKYKYAVSFLYKLADSMV